MQEETKFYFNPDSDKELAVYLAARVDLSLPQNTCSYYVKSITTNVEVSHASKYTFTFPPAEFSTIYHFNLYC